MELPCILAIGGPVSCMTKRHACASSGSNEAKYVFNCCGLILFNWLTFLLYFWIVDSDSSDEWWRIGEWWQISEWRIGEPLERQCGDGGIAPRFFFFGGASPRSLASLTSFFCSLSHQLLQIDFRISCNTQLPSEYGNVGLLDLN